MICFLNLKYGACESGSLAVTNCSYKNGLLLSFEESPYLNFSWDFNFSCMVKVRQISWKKKVLKRMPESGKMSFRLTFTKTKTIFNSEKEDWRKRCLCCNVTPRLSVFLRKFQMCVSKNSHFNQLPKYLGRSFLLFQYTHAHMSLFPIKFEFQTFYSEFSYSLQMFSFEGVISQRLL